MGSSEDTLLVLDPKPFKPFRSKDEYLYAMKEDLSEWFHCLYRIHISVENFFEILETGVILCDHAMSVQNFAKDRRILRADLELRSYFIREIPNGGIPCRRDVTPKTFPARDNVSNFITWCRRLGIPQVLLFETDDLVLRKNERSVVLCLLEVARIGAKLGMLAPVLVQMEEEIDAELAGEPPPQIKTCDLRSLDEMVRELVGRCTCPVQFPIVQVADGKYKIGDSQTLIFVRILRNHVMVRVGGGWDTLENYLDKHDPCRCGFRGHRNTSAVDHSKSPRRKISAPGGPVSRPKTPTSRGAMSVAVQQTGSGNNKQLIATRRPRTPSPERYLRSKSPFTPASPIPLNQPHRLESPSLAKTPEKRPPHSSVIVNSSSRGLPGTPSKLRSSSPNLSRVKSHSPEVQSTPKSRIPEPSRPKTPVFTRSQSPAPIRKPIALRDEDSNQRPKTPVQSRPKSPGLSQSALSYRADTARHSKSPGPVYGFTANDNRAPSPERSRTTRSKSPGPYSQHSLSMRASADTGSSSSTRDMRSKSPGPVHRPATPVDADQSTRIPRPKTPVRRSESPCRIPRPKTPVQRSTTATAHPMPNKLQHSRISGTVERPRCSNDQPDSAENNMESSGNSGINIEQISTMTLSEFKNLLSTSLSVPDGGPAEPAPASPRSSNNARANTKPLITGPKPQSPQLAKTARSKPPASPKRAQSVTSLVSSKDISSGQRYQDTTRRSLPQSPVDKNKPLPEQVVNVGSSSTQSVELSSPSETDIGPPARPSTPSSLASRLPRPKTPSGIPRPSTPVYSSSLPTKAGDNSSATPRARKQLPMAASTPRADSTEQSRLSESMSFKRRERSPSPPRRSVPSSGWFIDSSANPIENTESSGDSGIPSSSDNSIPTSGDDCKDSQQQQSSSCQCNTVGDKSLVTPTPVRKPSRLRPPSPSRVPLPRQSVETDTSQGSTRGRSTARTLPTPQFRKRPSSAGPVQDSSSNGVNAQESFQANQSSENSYVKKYFGRRNAKTIIKANSLSKAKSTVNLTTDSSSAESVSCASNCVTANNGSSTDDRSRSRTKKEGYQVRQRPKSAGPRPLVRQDAEDHSVIMVNRGGAGQHSVTVGTGEKTMYQTASQNIARPSSAKTRSIAPPGVSMATRTERGREVSKSVDNTDRKYRPKSAGPRAIVSRYERKGSRDENTTQVRERMRNKYVSTENLVQAWENKMSTERPAGRRQLPPQPRRCVTPGARFSRIRSTTPNPLNDEELTSRPLEEIKAALRLPINGVHKIQVDPDELTAPPEDAEMFRKMEELFHRYREKEAEVTQRNGHESASTGTNSDDQDRDQVSADDEAESVDSNANLRLTSLSGSSVSVSEDNADSGTEELDSVTIGSSVIAQLTEILKPKARKESPGTKSRIPAPQKRVRSVSDGSLKNSFGWSVKDSEPVNCDLDRGSLISGEHKHEGSHVFAPSNGLHRDDSSTSLSDISLNSSQGGYRCETPVPKLPTPLCTGRSTLVSMRSKDRSSSTSSSNGNITGRLVRAVSLDHSFTSTGNSIPDTSFSLAEDEDYV